MIAVVPLGNWSPISASAAQVGGSECREVKEASRVAVAADVGLRVKLVADVDTTARLVGDCNQGCEM